MMIKTTGETVGGGSPPPTSQDLQQFYESHSKMIIMSSSCNYDIDAHSLFWTVFDKRCDKKYRYVITPDTPIILPLSTENGTVYELAYVLIPFDIQILLLDGKLPISLTPEQESKIKLTDASLIHYEHDMYYVSSGYMPVVYTYIPIDNELSSQNIAGLLFMLVVPMNEKEVGNLITCIAASLALLLLTDGWIAVLLLWSYKLIKKIEYIKRSMGYGWQSRKRSEI